MDQASKKLLNEEKLKNHPASAWLTLNYKNVHKIYGGKWIAIDAEAGVVAASNTWMELYSAVKKTGFDMKALLVHQVQTIVNLEEANGNGIGKR